MLGIVKLNQVIDTDMLSVVPSRWFYAIVRIQKDNISTGHLCASPADPLISSSLNYFPEVMALFYWKKSFALDLTDCAPALISHLR